MAVISRTPAGMPARSSSTTLMLPVAKYSATLSAIDLPTPGICRSSPGPSVETSAEWPLMARAARE